MDNIEFFNRTTVALFRLLHQRFPRPIQKFDTEKFRTDAGLPKDPKEETSKDVGVIIKWLKDEGYVRFGTEASWGAFFTAVVLTGKGLDAMNRIPDALVPKMTVGERLKELSREASKEAVATIVKVALTGTA